jgi:hypothetical protein
VAGRLLTNVNAQVKRGMRHLVPIIQDRQRHIDEYGKDWVDKPVSRACQCFTQIISTNSHPQNDMLAWLMDEARGEEKSLRNLTLRVLIVNFSAIHTTTMVPTHFYISLSLYS